MLERIRNLARSPIAVAIIIVPIIAAFALFGISDIFTGTGDAVALVGEERVTVRELNRAYERELQTIQRENPRFTREQAEEIGLGEQVLQGLIARAAVDAKARQMGLAVSDTELRETIEALPVFRNAFSDQFDRQTYESVLSQNQMTPTMFERDVRGDIRRSQYITAVLAGLEAPDMLARARRAYAEERRDIAALLVSPSLAGEVGEPTDEELAAFIEENAEVFRRPEQRRFTLVRANPDVFARDVDVAEDDIRQLYEVRLENGALADPATRSFVQWPAPDRAAAEAAAERLAAGDAPEAVASDLGLGESTEFEALEAFEVPDSAVADAVFDLGADEAGAVEARLGWRVVRVTEAVDPEAPDFESMREELREELAADSAEAAMLDAFAVFEEARGAGATLAEAGREAGLPVERFDYVGENGFSADREPAATLLEAPEILTAVFAQPQGFAGDLQNYGENGYFAVRVDAVDAARLPDVSEVRTDAAAFWRVRRIDEQLQTIVDDALDRVEAGEPLDSIAADLGPGASVERATLRRDETAGPFTQALVSAAFRAEAETPFPARAGDQRTRAVAIVREVIAPETAAPAASTAAALTESLESDLTAALERGLRSDYEVRVDAELRDVALGRTEPARQRRPAPGGF